MRRDQRQGIADKVKRLLGMSKVETRRVVNPQDCPVLLQLLSGYFHQDWDMEHRDAAAVLEEAIAHAPTDRIRAGVDELTELLDRGLSEPELEKLLHYVLHVDYVPTADGLSYAQWLERVRDRFAKAIQSR